MESSLSFLIFAGGKRTTNNDLIELKFEIQLAESFMALYMIMAKINHEFVVTSEFKFSKASGGQNMYESKIIDPVEHSKIERS